MIRFFELLLTTIAVAIGTVLGLALFFLTVILIEYL